MDAPANSPHLRRSGSRAVVSDIGKKSCPFDVLCDACSPFCSGVMSNRLFIVVIC